MKKFLPVAFLIISVASRAQTKAITLEHCYQLAKQNYPLIKKHDLIAKTAEYSVENAGKLFLPQFSVSGQASYQSETIDFSKALGGAPGIALPVLSKDQYKIQAEVDQTIYDAGAVHNQRDLFRATAETQQQNLEVALYSLNDRINQIFFSIVLIDEEIKQNAINRNNFQNSADKAAAAYDNGTALKSNVDELKAEIATTEMTDIDLKSNRKSYTSMLSLFIGQPLADDAQLLMPPLLVTDPTIRRPEMTLFDLDKKIYDVQEKQLKSEYLPRLNAFVQGAYGRPTLNFIDNDFGPWWIGGLRLSWNLGSLYTLKNNRANLRISKDMVDIDRETFVFNTQLTLKKQDQDMIRYTALLREDDNVIALRNAVATAAKAQLDNGVITVHDYIAKVNAESLARQSKVMHTLQLLQTQYQYKNTSGN